MRPRALVVLAIGLLPACRGADLDRGSRAFARGDYATALRYIEPLARQGDAQAQFYLARMYETGRGRAADIGQAIQWYDLAAAQGLNEARNNLGVIYRDGEGGVPADPARARSFFHSAALMGNDDAQLSLGALYANGTGVPRDLTEAHAWYTLSAGRNNKQARSNLPVLARRMSPAQRAAADQRVARIREAMAGYDPRADNLALALDRVMAPPPPVAEEPVNRRTQSAGARGYSQAMPPQPGVTVPAGPAPQRGSGPYLRMRKVHVMDTQGWGQPVEALSFLIPVDWRLEGGVQWTSNIGCYLNAIVVQFRATSPDGSLAVEAFPSYVWTWADDPMQRQLNEQSAAQSRAISGQGGCEQRPPSSAADFIRGAVIPRYRGQGARVIGVEPLPGVAQTWDASVRPALAVYQQAGVQVGLRVDAARVRIQYQMNGRPMDEWIAGMTQVVSIPGVSASGVMQGMYGAKSNNYIISALNMLGTRAPAGQLEANAPLFSTILASMRVNPRWQAAVDQFMAGMANTAAKGARDRAEIWRNAWNDIGEMQRQGYEQRQQVQDRLALQFDQSIRGVETFVDPATNERIELTSGYRQAWSNGNGEYILSDDANFDPNRAVNGNWNEMRHPPH